MESKPLRRCNSKINKSEVDPHDPIAGVRVNLVKVEEIEGTVYEMNMNTMTNFTIEDPVSLNNSNALSSLAETRHMFNDNGKSGLGLGPKCS